jgi:hypothetical protein
MKGASLATADLGTLGDDFSVGGSLAVSAGRLWLGGVRSAERPMKGSHGLSANTSVFTASSEFSVGGTATKPASEVDASLANQRAFLLALPDGWDGYGAPKPPSRPIDRLLADLRLALQGIDCAAPDLIPGSDGSVQAEWHTKLLTLCYNVDVNGDRYLRAFDKRTGRKHQYFEPDAREALAKWVPRLGRTKAVALAA